jgi:ABC-type transport system substrate-binding protein
MTRIRLAAFLLLLAPLWIACAGNDESRTLRLAGSPSGVSTLDPALIRDTEGLFLARQVFRGLVTFDAELNVVPDLAGRIEVSEDGRTYRFTLEPDVRFQDGKPITAQDIVASFNRALDPALANGDGSALPGSSTFQGVVGVEDRLAGEVGQVAGINAANDETIVVQLAEASASFLARLAGGPALVVDVRETARPEWWLSPNGSGPFQVAEFDPASRLILESWGETRRDDGLAIETIEVRFGASALQPFNLYEAGEIDLVEVPGYAIDRVLSPADPLKSHLIVVPQLSTTFVALCPSDEGFSDPAVRRALGQVIDRPRVVEATFAGHVRLAEGLIPPSILGRDWPADLPELDIQAAQATLSAAVGAGSVPRILDPGAGLAVLLAEVAQQELGFEIEVVAPDWATFTALTAERNLPGFVLTWVADYPEPENFLTALFGTDSPNNYCGYSNPEVDRLLAEASRELDGPRRETLYLTAQQAIIDDGVVIPIYHGVSYTLVNPDVHGLVVSPAGILSLEGVWIED